MSTSLPFFNRVFQLQKDKVIITLARSCFSNFMSKTRALFFTFSQFNPIFFSATMKKGNTGKKIKCSQTLVLSLIAVVIVNSAHVANVHQRALLVKLVKDCHDFSPPKVQSVPDRALKNISGLVPQQNILDWRPESQNNPVTQLGNTTSK